SLRSLLDGLLGALEVLHRSGHIHREISPANILLLPDDHPVLLDFSAARRAIVGEQTQALMTLLEPSFAPMEQIAPSADQPQGAPTAVMPEPASPLSASDGAPAQPVPEGQWDPSQLDITTPRWPPTRSRSQQAAWWIGAALMLVAVGSAAWMFNQQRELSHA